MKKKLLICSLQYSPIYKSHCFALGRQANLNGFQIEFLLNNSYKWMIDKNMQKDIYYVGNSKNILKSLIDGINPVNIFKLIQILKREKPDYIYMFNIHPIFNLIITKLIKYYNYDYIQHIHEPYSENKKMYGGFSQIILFFFEKVQESIIKNSTKVVISSKRAETLFNQRYYGYREKLIKIPLIYEDAEEFINNSEKRELITFIGPLVPIKNPELFFKIVEYCQNYNFHFQFQLISRVKNDIPKSKYKNFQVLCDDQISDTQYGQIMQKSKIVIYPHKNPTQSSVVLTSFMYGIPVLASDLDGFREFISHKETGYLVDLEAPIENWINGLFYIDTNHSIMMEKCRNYYLENFSEKNWPQYFEYIF